MSTEENKALIRRFFDEINKLNVAALDEINKLNVAALDELVAPDYVDHNPPPFPGLAPGLQGGKQAFLMAQKAFSDVHHTIEDQIAHEDKVVTRLSVIGTHTGEIIGIPASGNKVAATGIAIHRIAGGKIVEHWGQTDLLGMLQQMGAIPAPGQSVG